MSDDERAVWRAAYAAAFVAAFDTDQAECRGYQKGSGYVSAFDQAAMHTTAERAVTLANLAVHRLRQWRDAEHGLAGVELPELPKLWEED